MLSEGAAPPAPASAAAAVEAVLPHVVACLLFRQTKLLLRKNHQSDEALIWWVRAKER